MIFKRRFNATFIVLLFSTFVASERRREDSKFDLDDLQVVYSDPPETAITPPSRYLYSKEIAQCPSSESKMMLTLLLQSLKWNDIGEKKREKAIKKMSRFFLVPMNSIKVDDIHTPEMLEMLKHSINKSNNLLNTKETVGRIEFPIGCGDKLFSNTKSLAHKINDYVKSGKLHELSGLPIHWWNIWSKHIKSRVQRTRRDTEPNTSGDAEDEYDYNEEDEFEGDEDENNVDTLPDSDHHDQRKKYTPKKQEDVHSTPQTPSHHNELPIVTEIENNEEMVESDINNNKINNANEESQQNSDRDYQVSPEDPSIPSEEEGEDVEVKEEISLPDSAGDIEEITQRTSDSAPTPIGTNEILKLENDVAKTIENDNNVGDVPPPPKQQDDKILEEWAQNVFSHPPNEDVTSSSDAQTTIQATTLSATEIYHFHENVPHETIVKDIFDEKKSPTIGDMLKETIASTMGVTSTTIINALTESETIFTSINNIHNEQHINAFIDEKLPIVTTTTIELPSVGIEQDSILTVENITDRIMPTFSSSSSLLPSSTYNYPSLMTNPTIITTTTNSAEITTMSNTSTEPSITDTTTTLRNVDATIAHVASVDKVKLSSASTPTAEKKLEEESNYDDEYEDEDGDFGDNSVDSVATEKSTSQSFRSTTAAVTNDPERGTPPPLIVTPQEDDDDDEDTEIDESVLHHLSSSPSPVPKTTATTTKVLQTTTLSSIPSTTLLSTTYEVTSDISDVVQTTSDSSDYDNEENHKPFVVKRMKKLQATAGKTFTYKLEDSIFEDQEDGKDLTIQLLDTNNNSLSANSWIRFDAKKSEIYGLPLENDVSKHEFKLRATDKAGESVDEIVDITVHQHKTLRSVNHEIIILLTLEKEYESAVDWKIRLIRGIVEALDDDSIASIVVRDVKRTDTSQKNSFTFIFSNDTLPKDRCPKAELEQLMKRLTKKSLNDALRREIFIRNVGKDLINACAEIITPPPAISTSNTKNYPPTIRNPIDKVDAIIGQLLVFVVPKDTFYDPEDQTELKLTLLYENTSAIDPNHWLQFDAKNKEFYGVPGVHDKNQGYLLVAEDKNFLKAHDALIVNVMNSHSRRDYSAAFEYQLEIGYNQFKNPSVIRKFIERLQNYFGDATTDSIFIKSVKKVNYIGHISVVVQNTTLYNRDSCAIQEIDYLKNRLVRQDGSVRDEIKQAIGSEFNVQKITVSRVGKCASGDTYHHHETSHIDRPDEKETPIINQDVLITYVLPSAIILMMLLIALLIACFLYKRRNTGKMELGDEEERKSFRSKGIPVIFQDELDEKPEIVTKSPIILKDEKPPLLPQYNGLSQDGEDENVDQYIPPQPLLMGSRESRGKSPVTPSYRKPPPYVSP